VFTSNLISQTTWLKVKLKLVNYGLQLSCPHLPIGSYVTDSYVTPLNLYVTYVTLLHIL